MKTYLDTQTQVCEAPALERPRYFRGLVVTPNVMTMEHDYESNKRRLHNRFLHGWGVVCGAQVCLVETADKKGYEPWKVGIATGFILSPFGDEIIINAERIFDLRTGGLVSKSSQGPGEFSDPWCAPVHDERLPEEFYIAVKYKEVNSRPVRVQPSGCGCNDQSCESSLICDGYEIGLLTHCLDQSAQPPDLANPATYFLKECPTCPEDPWVVLARIRINRRGQILEIDNCSCRRMVVSLANAWQRCNDKPVVVDIAEHRQEEPVMEGRGVMEADRDEAVKPNEQAEAPKTPTRRSRKK